MFQENTMGSNCNAFYRCLCSKILSMFMLQENAVGSNRDVFYRRLCSKKMQWDLTVTYFIDVYVPTHMMGSNCNVFYRCLCSKKIQWDLTVTYVIDVYVPRQYQHMPKQLIRNIDYYAIYLSSYTCSHRVANNGCQHFTSGRTWGPLNRQAQAIRLYKRQGGTPP